MEPSVEKGFSFLDLEDCDIEARQYLETILDHGGSSSTPGVTGSNKLKPSDTGEVATGDNSRLHSKKPSATALSDASVTVSGYPTESKSSKEGHSQSSRAVQDIGVATRTRISTSDKETVVATKYEASINVALTSRGSTAVSSQHPPSSQTPNKMNYRPIQQGPNSSVGSNFSADMPQVSCCQIGLHSFKSIKFNPAPVKC